MKKIMNHPAQFVDESLEGIIYAHANQLKFAQDEKRGIVRADAPIKGKVAIATGGGYGHLPTFLGYVGTGLADGVSIGNVFTSPSADAMVNVAKSIDGGAGVLFLYGHYFGDKMNFDLAAEMLEEDEGIPVKTVRVSDDAASASRDNWQKRRGVAGLFFAYKIAGACAESLATLDQVQAVAEKTASNMATLGVALTSCIIPDSGKPTFTIADNEMEIGMGIHGEPGIKRTVLKSAKDLSEELIHHLTEDLSLQSGDEVAILVNGLGSTPLEELYIINREVHILLENKGIKIYKTYVGEYATSMEMAGCSVTLLKLDEELKRYLDAPADSPFFKQFSEESR